MSLPLAVHYKLDLLARLAEDVNASRAEVVAMLIAEADLDIDVEQRLLAYRKLLVEDVIPADSQPGDDEDNVVVPLAKAGRPKKRSAG